MAETMVERVARAIFDSAGGTMHDTARAAIAAMREPTPAMVRSAWSELPSAPADERWSASVWGAMVTAALGDPPGGSTPAWDSRTSSADGGPAPCVEPTPPIEAADLASSEAELVGGFLRAGDRLTELQRGSAASPAVEKSVDKSVPHVVLTFVGTCGREHTYTEWLDCAACAQSDPAGLSPWEGRS